ncbi:MAG: hypothetical protein ACK518_00495 [bacterium]
MAQQQQFNTQQPHPIVPIIAEVKGVLIEQSLLFMILTIWAVFQFFLRNKIDKSMSIKELIRQVSSIDRDVKIYELLNIIRHNIGADRVLLHQFHNTGTFSSGLKFFKLTCTHETLKAGVSSVQRYFHQVPISDYCYDLQDLLKSNSFLVIDANSSSLTPKQQAQLDLLGIKVIQQHLILDERGVPIGLLAIHSITGEYKNASSPEIMEVVNLLAYLITTR